MYCKENSHEEDDRPDRHEQGVDLEAADFVDLDTQDRVHSMGKMDDHVIGANMQPDTCQ